MTIELAPHHMLIITDYWMIIPWSDLRKSRSFPGFYSTGKYGKPWLRSAAEENREGPMLQKSQKTRDESIGGTREIIR